MKIILSLIILIAISGCVSGNRAEANAIKFEPSRNSTTAENIEAGGRAAAGAWDRLGNLWQNH